MNTRRFVLTLNLKDDSSLIETYIEYHKKVWPSIKKSITDSGIQQMEIFQLNRNLCMILEVDETFSFERKEIMDAENEDVQKWERLMENYQEVDGSGHKWKLMDKIFDLIEN